MTNPNSGQEGSAGRVLSEDRLKELEQAIEWGVYAGIGDSLTPALLATIRHLQAEARAVEPLVRAAEAYSRIYWQLEDIKADVEARHPNQAMIVLTDKVRLLNLAEYELLAIARSKATDTQGA